MKKDCYYNSDTAIKDLLTNIKIQLLLFEQGPTGFSVLAFFSIKIFLSFSSTCIQLSVKCEFFWKNIFKVKTPTFIHLQVLKALILCLNHKSISLFDIGYNINRSILYLLYYLYQYIS